MKLQYYSICKANGLATVSVLNAIGQVVVDPSDVLLNFRDLRQ